MRKWGKESRKEGGRKETGKSHRVEGTPLRTDIAQSLVFLGQGNHAGSSYLAQGGTVPPASPHSHPSLGAGFRLEVSGVREPSPLWQEATAGPSSPSVTASPQVIYLSIHSPYPDFHKLLQPHSVFRWK